MDADIHVYGDFTAPQGLDPVLKAVKQLAPDGRAYIYRSQFNGAETLHFRSELVAFDSDPTEDGDHLFSGEVFGALEDVWQFVQELSKSLAEANIRHRFEVYEDAVLVKSIGS